MSILFGDRTYDYKLEHKELDHTPEKGVYCTWCGKTVDDRETLPDYGIFMGAVWIKDNLPCKPYDNPNKKADESVIIGGKHD